MTITLKARRSASAHSTQVVKARHDGSLAHAVFATSVVHAVSPTSERIIKKTSLPRRIGLAIQGLHPIHVGQLPIVDFPRQPKPRPTEDRMERTLGCPKSISESHDPP